MDIFLVRHGEAAASWSQASDPGLSELGQEQAETAAQELLPLLSSQVQLISSPLLRARETAAALASALGVAGVEIDDAFGEIPSTVPLQQRQAWLREFMRQQWETQPDSLQDWRAGMMGQLLGLQKQTVVFTHFLVLNAVIGKLQDRGEILCFWPDNASIVRLRHTGSALELVKLGRQMSTVVN